MTQRVVIHWGLSSLHGWGVYGLNLALAWAGDAIMEAAATAKGASTGASNHRVKTHKATMAAQAAALFWESVNASPEGAG